MNRLSFLLKNIVFLPAALLVTGLVATAVIILGHIPGSERILQKLETWWAKLVTLFTGVRMRIDGPELDPQQTYLFVANHQSLLDIPVLLKVLSPWFPRFVAKDSLFSIPLFGPGMRRTGHLGVNRTNSRQGMRDMNTAAQRIQAGQSLLIFPEGTRSSGAMNLHSFHIGAFVIALKANVPIVPVLIAGTGRIMPKNRFSLHPGEVHIRLLPPRPVPEGYTLKDRDALKDALWAEMDTTLREMHAWTTKND